MSRLGAGAKVVDIGVGDKEGVDIPQCQEEAARYLQHHLLVKTADIAWRRRSEEVPAQGISAIFVNDFPGPDDIPFALAHLLALGIQDVPQADDILIADAVEEQGGDGVQAVKPATRLVNRLADVVGREAPVLEYRLVLEGVVVLGDGHIAGVEPAVNDLRHALHSTAALRAVVGYFVDEGAVQVERLGQASQAGLLFQLLHSTHAVVPTAGLTTPDG